MDFVEINAPIVAIKMVQTAIWTDFFNIIFYIIEISIGIVGEGNTAFWINPTGDSARRIVFKLALLSTPIGNEASKFLAL